MNSESELASQREAAARAKAAYAALQEFQGFSAERGELLAAGVPLHTIDSLYPQSFADLTAGVLAHLRATGHAHIEHLWGDMFEMRDVSEEIMCAGDEQLTRAWENAFPLKYRAEAEQLELEEFLYDAFGETSKAQGIADDFVVMLWGAWICMRHRAMLSPEKRIDADYLMDWVASNMLPHLAVASEAEQLKVMA